MEWRSETRHSTLREKKERTKNKRQINLCDSLASLSLSFGFKLHASELISMLLVSALKKTRICTSCNLRYRQFIVGRFIFSLSIFSFDNFHIRFRNHGWMLSPDNLHSHCRWFHDPIEFARHFYLISFFEIRSWFPLVFGISFFYLIFPFSKLTHIGNYRIEFMTYNRQSMHCMLYKSISVCFNIWPSNFLVRSHIISWQRNQKFQFIVVCASAIFFQIQRPIRWVGIKFKQKTKQFKTVLRFVRKLNEKSSW